MGELLGRDARRRTAHVLLAPGVNLHRTPIGGRTFEYYSEDPALTSALAVAAVRGIQSNGVAVTVKHFVGNDTEVDRHTVDVRIDERAARAVLAPFEAAVRDGGAWGVMTGYNRLDGALRREPGTAHQDPARRLGLRRLGRVRLVRRARSGRLARRPRRRDAWPGAGLR